MRFVTVLTFDDPAEAQTLKQCLESAGVSARVLDERWQQRYRFLSEEVAGVHVQVERDSFERARQLLVEWEASEAGLKKAVHCPQCGSSRVEFPQATRKFLTPTLLSLLFALRLCEKRFYCEDCHYTWPLRTKPDEPTDILGWPIKSKDPVRSSQEARLHS
jgi:hypothetical protein